MEKKEIRERVQRALNNLEPDDATVIVLRDLQDIPYEEVARLLEVPVGTVKSRLHRARQALKSQLATYFYAGRKAVNCAEVQAQLLEYLDTSLDRISTKHVEIHLSSCPPCRAEADSLADCVRQVAALPIVDPPLGFAQRIMAHAREIDLTPTIWQRLALLMRNQIPLQAAAVVLVAVFSAYIYQTVDSPSAPVNLRQNPQKCRH